MEIEDYTDKSYVIYGETKPWREDLKAMFGRYGLYGGRQGWTFSKKHEAKLFTFVEQANAGQIQPGDTAAAAPPKRTPVTRPQTSGPSVRRSPPVGVRRPLSSTVSQVEFPNRFTAGDGTSYQILIYTVPMPVVGQSVIVRVGDTDIAYTVQAVISQDRISIVPSGDAAPSGVTPVEVCANRWQIRGMMEAHDILFG